MTKIPELTNPQPQRAIPASARRRLASGQIETGEDVSMLRRFVGLSQVRFAQALGISVHTLRNWEQNRRRPDGPALALLRIAARHPQVIRENLSQHFEKLAARPSAFEMRQRLARRTPLEYGESVAEAIAEERRSRGRWLTRLERHSHRPLVSRAWQLRHNVTIYDALYLALARASEYGAQVTVVGGTPALRVKPRGWTRVNLWVNLCAGRVYAGGDLRILWFYGEGQIVVLTAGFVKKSQKTPKSEVEAAERTLARFREAVRRNALEVEEAE